MYVCLTWLYIIFLSRSFFSASLTSSLKMKNFFLQREHNKRQLVQHTVPQPDHISVFYALRIQWSSHIQPVHCTESIKHKASEWVSKMNE